MAGGTLHQLFLKQQVQVDFDAVNELFYMLDNDNIITSVSEAVEKIPQMKKIIANTLLWCFAWHSHNIQRADQHIL